MIIAPSKRDHLAYDAVWLVLVYSCACFQKTDKHAVHDSYASFILIPPKYRTDTVQALDMGADDYLTKPFGISELLVRVRVQLRRKQDAADRENESIIKLGKDVEVDTERKVVTKGGELVHLTKLELRLLLVMLSEPEKVLTQRYIVQKVWGAEYIEHPHYLRIYMGRLRNKIEDDPSNPSILLTESGVGYRLALKPQSS